MTERSAIKGPEDTNLMLPSFGSPVFTSFAVIQIGKLNPETSKHQTSLVICDESRHTIFPFSLVVLS